MMFQHAPVSRGGANGEIGLNVSLEPASPKLAHRQVLGLSLTLCGFFLALLLALAPRTRLLATFFEFHDRHVLATPGAHFVDMADRAGIADEITTRWVPIESLR
jgi:hypothetical protein